MVKAANEAVLEPLAGLANRTASLGARSADIAVDYFHWANNFGEGRVMTTGARVLQETGLSELQSKHAAERAYAEIRSASDDVAAIAKATGRPDSEIAQIKDHVFVKQHRLADGLRRFDADPQIAATWERLQAGTHTAEDLIFLTHELAESSLMKAGMTQAEAHEAVNAFLRGETASTFSVGNTHLSASDVASLQRLDGIDVTGPGGAGAARPPRHHIFAQEYRDWFEGHGIDIDRFTIELTQGEHTALHTMGWNDQIERFIEREAQSGERYTRREILEFGVWLRRRYGLRGRKVGPYGG
jgi:hypothetical protein